jgi:hypothetical protein
VLGFFVVFTLKVRPSPPPWLADEGVL